jgi:MOSC domain-containing protein YiiM
MPSNHPTSSTAPATELPRDSAGEVVGIYTAPEAGAPMEQQGSVIVAPGVGIVGDRYALHTGHWSDPQWPDQELTLFEAEVADALGIEHYVPRRNLVMRGVSLHGLIDVRFRLGGALLAGVRPCDPCRYIEQLTGVPGLTEALAGARGGLRVRIIEGGKIRLGDTIEVLGLDEE